jgi:hypothetical protein
MSFYVIKNLNRPSATGATDPATLPLALYVKDAYPGTSWPGTASAGTSGSHNLVALIFFLLMTAATLRAMIDPIVEVVPWIRSA